MDWWEIILFGIAWYGMGRVHQWVGYKPRLTGLPPLILECGCCCHAHSPGEVGSCIKYQISIGKCEWCSINA